MSETTAPPSSGANPDVFDIADEEEEGEGADVQRWLTAMGLGRYFGLLQAEGFDDFRIIQGATEEDLRELITLCAMPRMHAKHFRRGIIQLQAAAAEGSVECLDDLIETLPNFGRTVSADGVPTEGGEARLRAGSDASYSESVVSCCEAASEHAVEGADCSDSPRAVAAQPVPSSPDDCNATFSEVPPEIGLNEFNTEESRDLLSQPSLHDAMPEEDAEKDDMPAPSDAAQCPEHVDAEDACSSEPFVTAKSCATECEEEWRPAEELDDKVEVEDTGTETDEPPPLGLAGMIEIQAWKVVGGKHAGGVLVRTGQDLKSPETVPPRLHYGAIVRELALVGQRLNFELVSGNGPKTGWVTTTTADRALLIRRGYLLLAQPPQQLSPASEADWDLPDLVAGSAEPSSASTTRELKESSDRGDSVSTSVPRLATMATPILPITHRTDTRPMSSSEFRMPLKSGGGFVASSLPQKQRLNPKWLKKEIDDGSDSGYAAMRPPAGPPFGSFARGGNGRSMSIMNAPFLSSTSPTRQLLTDTVPRML